MAFFHNGDTVCSSARVVGKNSVYRCAEGRIVWKYPRLGCTVLTSHVHWPLVRPASVTGRARDTRILYARSEVGSRDEEEILQGSRLGVLDLWKHCRVERRKVINKARVGPNFPPLPEVPFQLH